MQFYYPKRKLNFRGYDFLNCAFFWNCLYPICVCIDERLDKAPAAMVDPKDFFI